MSPDVTSHPLPAEPDDVEVARVKAVLEARFAGVPQAPTHIGRFVVLDRIGAGGMGVVYAAFDPQLDRKVAIKLLFDAGTDERERLRLLGEAKAMAKLAHPNVVGVYEVGTHNGKMFVAMEHVRGQTLKRWLRARAHGWREILAVFVQAGQGLSAAHAAGVVHRDFKPDNVLVGEDGRARVVDFGLARQAAEERTDPQIDLRSSASDSALTKLTRTGAIVGTPAYMAPEQIRGEPIDARADQFGFCVAAWEALAGQRPFAGETVESLFQHVTRGELREAPRGLPGWVVAALRRGLHAQPERRHASMAALLAALADGEARRRRRGFALGAGAAVLLGVGAWGGWQLELGRRRSACATEAASIAAVWNDDAKTRLHDALRATGVTFAESTFERAVPFVDRYADAWGRDHAQLCVATEVERERSPELWAASRACLEDRRGELGALLEVLTEDADATSAGRTITAASELTPLDLCRDDAWLARNFADGSDDDLGDELRRRSWRASGLTWAGDPYAALELARTVAQDAEAAGLATMQRSALLLAGTAAGRAERLDEAVELLVDAFDLALAAGDDAVARAAATELVLNVGATPSKAEEALWWGRIARGLQARMGADGDLAAARLAEVLTQPKFNLANRAPTSPTRLDEVGQLLTEAHAIRERLLGPDHPDVALLSSWLANQAFNVAFDNAPGDYAESLRLWTRSLESLERAVGADHPLLALPLTGSAWPIAESGDYDGAMLRLERSAAIASGVPGQYWYEIENDWHRAMLNHRRGAFRAALPLYERSISRLVGVPDQYPMAQLLRGLGNTRLALGDHAEAEELLVRALATADRELHPDSLDRAQVLGSLGNLRSIRGEHDDAVARIEQALDIVERTVGPENIWMTVFLDLLGDAQVRREDFALARASYERSLEIHARVLGADAPGQAITLARLARAEVRAGADEDARTHARRAIEFATTQGDRSLPWLVVHEHGTESHLLGPGVLPAARFTFAIAAWHEGDRAGALALARQARDGWKAAGEGFERKLAETVAWIAAHEEG